VTVRHDAAWYDLVGLVWCGSGWCGAVRCGGWVWWCGAAVSRLSEPRYTKVEIKHLQAFCKHSPASPQHAAYVYQPLDTPQHRNESTPAPLHCAALRCAHLYPPYDPSARPDPAVSSLALAHSGPGPGWAEFSSQLSRPSFSAAIHCPRHRLYLLSPMY
jgi:hypothetical protein